MIQPPRTTKQHTALTIVREVETRPLYPAAGIQGVAQSVTDKVDSQDGKGYGDTGEDDGVLALDEDTEPAAESVGQHRAPLGGRSAGSEAQERERGHVQYRRCERQ